MVIEGMQVNNTILRTATPNRIQSPIGRASTNSRSKKHELVMSKMRKETPRGLAIPS